MNKENQPKVRVYLLNDGVYVSTEIINRWSRSERYRDLDHAHSDISRRKFLNGLGLGRTGLGLFSVGVDTVINLDSRKDMTKTYLRNLGFFFGLKIGWAWFERRYAKATAQLQAVDKELELKTDSHIMN